MSFEIKDILGYFRKLDVDIAILQIAATDMRYFARSKFSKSLVYTSDFSWIWQVSFQARVCILSKEVGYLFWIWMDSEKSRKQQQFSVNL